jgi:prolyl-tRNA editing enzyme YbaK/EbsC (Cys-tRNA(Pro) deacylase)
MFMDIEQRLNEAGLWHRFIVKPETSHTADALLSTGIELERITKNLVCNTAEGLFALLIVAGDGRESTREKLRQSLESATFNS